eukprot:symbB.v1.2.036147.t1/scaffold5035.1/size31620/2
MHSDSKAGWRSALEETVNGQKHMDAASAASKAREAKGLKTSEDLREPTEHFCFSETRRRCTVRLEMFMSVVSA